MAERGRLAVKATDAPHQERARFDSAPEESAAAEEKEEQMAGAQKHRERSRYRDHQQKPFVMFARNAYVKHGAALGAASPGMFTKILRTMKKRKREKAADRKEAAS